MEKLFIALQDFHEAPAFIGMHIQAFNLDAMNSGMRRAVFMFFHGENQGWFPSNVGWKSQLIADNGFCRVQNMTACGREG